MRLSKLYALWKGVLAPKVEVEGGAKAKEVERELRCRAHALECIVTFLHRLPDGLIGARLV